jgi:hypothetical protein
MKPTEYWKESELAGWKVRLTSYRLGDKCYCKADNVERSLHARTRDYKEEWSKAVSQSERFLSGPDAFERQSQIPMCR